MIDKKDDLKNTNIFFAAFAKLFYWFISLALAGALFGILTNFVPLIQMGWVEEFGKKGRYIHVARIATYAFVFLLLLVRWLTPAIFKRLWIVRLWHQVCEWPPLFTATVFFITYAGMMALVGFERHLALETRAFDLGIFAQAVWNTTQGKFLFSSIKENICLLGDHVSPILVLLVPFYKLWSDPRLLVFFQAVAAASSFFPIAILAEKKLRDRSMTLVLLLMFFFFYPTRSALLEDFHPEVIAEPFLWWAFLFLDERKLKWFVLSLLIAITGKENFLGIAFMLGFYTLLQERLKLLGISIMVASVSIFLWETKWLVPYLTQQPFFYAANYSSVLEHPGSIIAGQLFSIESLEYVVRIFGPFLFLPFAHIQTLLLTFPVLFQNLLSSNGGMRSLNFHYVTGLSPFLFISTIVALSTLKNTHRWINLHMRWIGFALLFVSVLRSGASEYYFFWHIHSHRNAHTEMVREKLRDIPRDAVVLTHNNLIPQLCNRERIYQFDYNAVNSKLDYARKYRADYVVGDAFFWEPNTQSIEQTLNDLEANGYQMLFEKDGFFSLRKNKASQENL